MNRHLTGLKQRAFAFLRMALMILAVLGLAVVAEFIKPLQELDGYLGDHPGLVWWLNLMTLGLAMVGVLLLVGTQFMVRVGDEYRLSRAEVKAMDRPRRSGRGKYTYRFSGRSSGTGFSDQASFREFKAAWRRSAWRTSPRWRRFFLMMVGAICLVLGLFGFFMVVGPPLIKLIYGLALLYVAIQSGRGFWRA